MDVAGILAKKRQDVTAYRIIVTGNQRDEYPQVYTDVVITHEVDGRGVSEAAVRRAIELSALKYCPVNAMLSPAPRPSIIGTESIPMELSLRSRGRGAIDRPVPPTGRVALRSNGRPSSGVRDCRLNIPGWVCS
jgi:hypothetical protein